MNEEQLEKLRNLIEETKEQIDLLYKKQKEIIASFLKNLEEKKIEEIREKLKSKN